MVQRHRTPYSFTWFDGIEHCSTWWVFDGIEHCVDTKALFSQSLPKYATQASGAGSFRLQ